MTIRCITALTALVIATHTTTTFADSVTLEAVKDNTMFDESADLSNGAGDFFFAGRTAMNQDRRGLIMFDLATDIPAGSTITSVSLQLYMSRTVVGDRSVGLHRALADWGEAGSEADGQEGAGGQAEPGDATWAHTFYDTEFWGTLGGDFAGASGTIVVGSEGFYTWPSTPGLVADVQAWVGDAATNFGWVVIGDETGQSAKRFNSRTAGGSSARHPKLTIEFTPPSETGACCYLDGSCLLQSMGDCTAGGGDYQGDGEPCTPETCPQPTGACCLVDGTCVVQTPSECAAAGGAYEGDDEPCIPDPCPQPTGACCLPNTACTIETADDCAALGGAYQGDGTGCMPNPCQLEPFVDPLPLPGVAVPDFGTPGGEADYTLEIVQLEQQLHRDLPPTTVWGFDGSYPGPTIEARKDLPVTVTWVNDLRDAAGELRTDHYLPVDLCLHGPAKAGPTPRTVVHLHGGHVPMESDGYPEHTFLPGESVVYEYPNIQDAATIWYHDHALGITRLNVYMGMAGLYLIRDDVEDALDLPDGAYEVPIVIQDRTFEPDGKLVYPADWQDHFFGDTLLVNGKVWPFLEVEPGLYRFRILNGSTSRTYVLTLSNGGTFNQIGGDGGLLPATVPQSELTLASGERADVIVDFTGVAPGTEIILQNSAPAPFPGEAGVGVIPEVMKFIVVAGPGFEGSEPTDLRPIVPLEEADATMERDLVLRKASDPCTGSIWLINGLKWDDITERPVLGDTEVWRFINRSGIMHPMHMHLVFFQVLDRQAFEVVDDEIVPIGDPIPPEPNESGWKDTVRVNPSEITRVITRFEDFTGLFAYHCHILEHEDHEMMRQFEVVLPCPGDVDGDRMVGFTDLVSVLAAWGPCPGCPQDIDDDGEVGFTDLLTVLSAWGPCP